MMKVKCVESSIESFKKDSIYEIDDNLSIKGDNDIDNIYPWHVTNIFENQWIVQAEFKISAKFIEVGDNDD